MTISAVVPDIAFPGTSGAGTMGPFSLIKSGSPLVFYANSEVVVLRYDSGTDTTPTLLVEGTDYTLTGGPTAGVVTLTSPQTGLLTAERLYVTTLSVLAQSLDLVNGGNFSSSNLERRLDVIFQILQQHAREIKSTIRFAMFDTDEIPKTTPLGAVIDKVPYVTGTTSAPTVAYLDALVLNDLAEMGTENFANIAIVAADLAGADTIGIVAAGIADVETVADNMTEVLAVAGALDENGNVIGLVGPQGPTGPAGPTGPTGPPGPAGDGAGDMLKSENLSGLANYTTARSNLGLPLGTSGATVPLLNGANTWSAQQTFSPGDTETIFNRSTDSPFTIQFRSAGTTRGYVGMDSTNFQVWNTALDRNLTFNLSTGVLSVTSNTVWHAGNDGAGSGLDADTVDGVQGSAFGQLGSANSWNNAQTLNYGFDWRFRNSSSNFTAGSAGTSMSLFSDGIFYIDNYESGGFAFRGASFATLATLTSSGWTARPAASTETTGTLTVASANRTIQATGDITIPNAVFAAGDIILIYAGASARTITQGASVTMRLGGSSTTGSRTLAARGVAVLFFVSSSEVVVSGGAVT